MTSTDYFKLCRFYWRGWYIFKTADQHKRGWELHRAKRDMEIARAFMNFERKKGAYRD